MAGAEVEATTNGQKVFAFIATDTTDMAASGLSQIGRGIRLFVHLPDVGSQVEYECFDLLSYSESLRVQLETSGGDALRVVKAPMPCKVLIVNKENGQKVQAGETVLVIESMKMEMGIIVAMEGILELNVREGDAVNEGTVLCSVAEEA
jgi:acetyl/propionyl-CoA carboxylase alpha subunit